MCTRFMPSSSRVVREFVLVVALIVSLLDLRAEEVIGFVAPWRYRKGTEEASAPDNTAWRALGFADQDWATGDSPLHYGEDLPGTLLDDMQGNYPSVYLRKAFQIPDPASLAAVRLYVLSDDGFVAWINGIEVARFNVPAGELAHTATALGTFSEPLPVETYEILNFRDILVPGTNVIAVHGFNASLGSSSDFVFAGMLEVVVDDVPPRVEAVLPAEGARVTELSRIEVGFDELVSGVEARDFLVNGVAATNVTAVAGDRYVFEFPAVPNGKVTVAWAADAGIRDLSARQNPFAGGAWSYTVDPNAPQPGVFLSEFMADNRRTLRDEDGDASDWIEIVNTSETTVSLAGWSLTDSAALPAKWRFPAVSIAARGRLVLFASGKNRVEPSARLHTNFRLERRGGYLGLYRANGNLASEFVAYPEQLEDVSYGRPQIDPLAAGYFLTPTPGAPNAEGGAGFGPDVTFSRIGGTFSEPFDLRVTTEAPTAGAVVRYTADGTVPTESSPVFPASLHVTNSVRIRARAFVPGLLPGRLRAEYYPLLNPAAATAVSTLPYVVIHSFGGGGVPADGEYPAFLAIHEPHGGMSSLTNAPDLRTRVRLNIRGSSTMFQTKRNYSVEFRDEREVDRDLAPLGLPADSDWVLYAPNNFEPILIHNPLAFRLSNEIGRYAPRTRFVELYIQTGTGAIETRTYAGIYVLMEKIKRGQDRVAIDRLEPEQSQEPAVSGGYMLKVDRLDPGDGGLYAGFQAMGFVDPKEEEMNLPQRQAQRTYIANYLDGFANALYGADFRDPVRGWRPYVDQGSWIDHHLLNVLAFNVDALRLSAFFYKPRGGKLEFGPVWDFDRALYSTDGRDSNPRVWRSTVSDLGTDFFNYTWWGRLFEDPDFWQAWIDRYQDLRRTTFSTNHLFALIDELTGEVKPAQPREVARWGSFTAPRSSYSNEIVFLKTWFTRRLNFMDTNFLAAPNLELPGGTVDPGALVSLTAPAGATIYFTLDGSDPRAPGGAVSAKALTYTAPFPLSGSTVVRARSRNLAHRNLTGPDRPPISSPWSGLSEARYVTVNEAGPGDLRFSEIHYHPLPPSTNELAKFPLATSEDFEFLELENRGERVVDLFGLSFAEGVSFNFRTSTIPVLEPGARLVLARNPEALRFRYGDVPNLAGRYAGALDDGGESLVVVDESGQVVLRASYRDDAYPATDGLGFSLVAREVDALGAAADQTGRRAWEPAAAAGGSPGLANPPRPSVPTVVIQEVLAHTDPPLVDGIELYNPGPEPAMIGGWYLTDDRKVPAKYRLPAETTIPGGGYRWFDETAFNANTNLPTSFSLDSTGDQAWLFAAGADGSLSGYAHGLDFGATMNGVSLGRELNCDGDEVWREQASVTPGAANSGARAAALVISEVHYHPPDLQLGSASVDDASLEFIEITNPSATGLAFPLADPLHPTNAWKLKDAVSFDFPTHLSVPPRGVVVVVNFDPDRNPQALARFRQVYNVPEGAVLVGPFEGKLDNSSGRVELARPDNPQLPPAPDAGFVPYLTTDRVDYADDGAWAREADGAGASLQRIRLDLSGEEPRNWVARMPTPGALAAEDGDADGDRMPDAWELAHCLDPNSAGDALADADGDGAVNLQEYGAGTNPRDPADALRCRVAWRSEGSVEIRFPAKAGRSYRVERAAALESGIWDKLADQPATSVDQEVLVSDARGTEGVRFYRVRLLP